MHFINPGIPKICFVKCSAKAKRVLLTLRVFFEQDQQNVSSLLLNRSLVFEVKGKRSKWVSHHRSRSRSRSRSRLLFVRLTLRVPRGALTLFCFFRCFFFYFRGVKGGITRSLLCRQCTLSSHCAAFLHLVLSCHYLLLVFMRVVL